MSTTYGTITEILERDPITAEIFSRSTIRWTSSYQGETDYEDSKGRRLRFRWGKVPYVWGWERPGERYWNFDSEEEFQRELNGRHGLLLWGVDPVEAETLAEYRQFYRAGAKTGYYDFDQRRYIQCEPTKKRLGTESWERFKAKTERN